MTWPTGVLQVKYSFLSGGAEVRLPLELPEGMTGEATTPLTLQLKREQSSNTSETVIVESAIMLGATVLKRSLTGTDEEGFEIANESMLEYSLDGTTWAPVGPGPSVDIADWFSLEAGTGVLLGYYNVYDPPPPPPRILIPIESLFPDPPNPPYEPVYGEGEVPSPQTKIFFLRLNTPNGASTTGDFRVWLEVFITE